MANDGEASKTLAMMSGLDLAQTCPMNFVQIKIESLLKNFLLTDTHYDIVRNYHHYIYVRGLY